MSNELSRAMMFGMPGHGEIWVLLAIILIIFGPKNLPKLASAMGQAIKNFKSGMSGVDEEIEEAMNEAQAPMATKAHIESKSSISTAETREPVGEKKTD